MRSAELASLTFVYMFDQGLRALSVCHIFTDYFVGLDLFERFLETCFRQREYVVYHAERGRQLGSSARRQQRIRRIKHGSDEQPSIGQALQPAHKIGRQHIEVAGDELNAPAWTP